MAKYVDYLIIGQGLAGSLLSWELIKRGCNILLIDNGQENASQIAAGMINPITGMRLVKSHAIDLLLPIAKKTYREIGEFFHQDLYIEKGLMRIIRHNKELAKYQQRIQDPDYMDYLQSDLKTGSSFIHAPLGIIQQKQTGYLLTQKLLGCLKSYLKTQQSYKLSQFDYRHLQINNSIQWHTINAKKIIFCEGHQAINNPWFNYLPFQLAKGEILTLTTNQVLPLAMLNYGHWLIPLDQHQFRTGATFDNTTLDTEPSLKSKNILFNALTQIVPTLKTSLIIKQQANIRPTTLDKMPLIGHHPVHNNLYIFNGFGAKGSLQIPYYSQQLADHLLNGAPIASSVNCQRYQQ